MEAKVGSEGGEEGCLIEAMVLVLLFCNVRSVRVDDVVIDQLIMPIERSNDKHSAKLDLICREELTGTRLEPRNSISNNLRTVLLSHSLLLQLHPRIILPGSQAQRRNSRSSSRRMKPGSRRSYIITVIKMTCSRHDIGSSITDVAVSHELRKVEKALGRGARGRGRRHVMVMVVVIGLASHGGSSVDHRLGFRCRQKSHACSPGLEALGGIAKRIGGGFVFVSIRIAKGRARPRDQD